jgi:hypothetical protein
LKKNKFLTAIIIKKEIAKKKEKSQMRRTRIKTEIKMGEFIFL